MKNNYLKIKNLYGPLLMALGLTFGVGFGANAQFSGGDGSAANPYQIANKMDLKTLTDNSAYWSTGIYFIQTGDIMLTSADFVSNGIFYNGGAGFKDIGNDTYYFAGNYDGQGHIIDSMFVNRPSEDIVGGLFGRTKGNTSIIQNVGLTNLHVIGKDFTGGVVATINDNTIKNCYATGYVGGGSTIGGVVSFIYVMSGIVNSCYFNGTVNGNSGVGGVIGTIHYGSLNNSYSSGHIMGNTNVGGVVGNLGRGNVNYTYSNATVVGTNGVGGLVGTTENMFSVIKHSLWNIDYTVVGIDNIGTGSTIVDTVGISTIEMQKDTSFLNHGFDFVNETVNGNNNFWVMGDTCSTNNSNPILTWQMTQLPNLPNGGNIQNSITHDCSGTGVGAIDLTVTGGNPTFTYAWSNGSINQDLASLSGGEYSVIITDNKGCGTHRSYKISSPTASVTSNNSSSCQNGVGPIVTFTGSNGIRPYTFDVVITTNNGIDTTSVFQSTTSGYSDTTHFIATTDTALNYEIHLIQVSDAVCNRIQNDTDDSVSVSIISPSSSIDNVTACFSYTWIDGNTYISSYNTATFVLPNAAGCDSTITLDLTIQNPPVTGTLYVDANNTNPGCLNGSTWSTAMTSLKTALNYAQAINSSAATATDSITQIWVADGIYYPDNDASISNNDQNASFQLLNGVAIYGGFSGGETLLRERDPQTNISILSGDIDSNDITTIITDPSTQIQGSNSYHVVDALNTNHSAILDGFTITAGKSSTSGGGIIAVNGSPSLNQLRIVGNIAVSTGGAMYLSTNSDTIIVTNSILENNLANNNGGGIYINVNGQLRMINSKILNNKSQLNDAGFYNNIGYLELNKCELFGNTAQSLTGAGYTDGTTLIMNSLIHNNHANECGAIFNGGQLTIINTTITNNTASSNGGGLQSRNDNNANITIINSIIWGNTTNGSSNDIFIQGGTVNIDHSLTNPTSITGTVLSDNVPIHADPLFVDTANNDYHLTCSSPAINMGDNSFVTTNDSTDFAGITPRILEGTVDIGAFESGILSTLSIIDSSICANNDVAFIANINYAYPDYVWQVSTDNGNTWTSVGSIFKDTLMMTSMPISANGNLYRIADTACVGIASSPALLTVNALPQPIIAGSLAFCQGDSTTLSVAPSVGDAAYTTYEWNGNATDNADTLNITTAANNSIEVTDVNGCKNAVSVTTVVNALPQPTISGTLTFCQGDSTTLSVAPSVGDTTYTDTLWVGTIHSPSLVITTAGTGYVQVTDVNGCKNTVSGTTVVNALPQPTISGTLAFCVGDSTTLTATPGSTDVAYATYEWNGNATHNASTLNVTTAGSNSIEVTDVNGCKSIVSVTTVVNALPQPTISGTLAFCAGDSTTLTATPGSTDVAYATYEWNGNATHNASTLNVTTAGNNSVEVTDVNGCIATSAPVTTVVYPNPTVTTITQTDNGNNNYNFSSDAMDVISYSWNFGDGSAVATTATATHQYTTAGTYTVTLTVTNSCGTASATATVVSTVGTMNLDDNQSIAVYPNPSKGVYTITSTKDFSSAALTVYTLEGKVVYQSVVKGTTVQLDLTQVPAGVYFLQVNNAHLTKLVKE